MDVSSPQYFINRELSWMEFNSRVLGEAQDKTTPIFERLKFLAIASSNLDEFFMVRVSRLFELYEAGYSRPDAAGLTPREQLHLICEKAHQFVAKQYSTLNRSILPQLDRIGFVFRSVASLNNSQMMFVKDYFYSTIYPVLTPMAIDQARPFPLLINKSLNIVVLLENEDEESDPLYAVVQIPSVLPRVLEIQSPLVQEGRREFVLLEEIIRSNIARLFEGHTVAKTALFRVTRDSDYDIDEEDAVDLLYEIEQSIKKRRWGEPIRLEIEKGMDAVFLDFLLESMAFDPDNIFEIPGFFDLTFLFHFYGIADTQQYKNEIKKPQLLPDLIGRDLFEAIYEKDIFMHHPYHSFDYVVDFVNKAATDPAVLAIKQTLYRVSGNSPIIGALITAAESGKQVTVLVELKARFDEENNIVWARKLEKAGCHVVYGLVGLKTHCKICLVVRKEEDGIRRYIHLGTGNYNDSTAKTYTDMGFFTCKEAFGIDVSSLFNVLTGYSTPPKWKKLAVAPETLRESLYTWIENEIQWAKSGGDAEIRIKCNSVVDKEIIEALYKASIAGVKIRMIVRGICCLRPGLPEISENITVYSIVDRFLEHSRIYYFGNGGEAKIFLSSADLMPRNLNRRIEVAFPIEEKELKDKIKQHFDISFEDTVKIRKMNADGSYEKRSARGRRRLQSQMEFQRLAELDVKHFNDEQEQRALYVPATGLEPE